MHLCYNLKSLEERQQKYKRKVDGGKGVSEEFATPTNIVRDYKGT
jgi:hypothetical protein